MRTRSLVHRGKADRGPVSERRSDFHYARFDRMRLENTAPLEHTVIWNGKTLWIWSPRENAVVEQPAENVAMASRAMLSVQPGYGLDLLAPIPLDAYAASSAPGATDGEVVVTLSPQPEAAAGRGWGSGGETPGNNVKAVPRATMQVVVDTGRRFVTRMALLSGTTILSDVRLAKPVEAKPGIWFATQVEVRQLLDDGSTLEELRTFERLAFDGPVDASRFELVVPEGATRVSVDSLLQQGEGRVQP